MTTRTAAFVGTMNAMPMAYALELKKQGWDVVYFVDVPAGDTLSRPEYKFPSITFPYPDWIIERPVRSEMIPALCPALFISDILRVLRRVDVVFLSGLFLTLERFLAGHQRVIFLSYGADLDVWCDRMNADRLAQLFSDRLGGPLARAVVRRVVNKMADSLRRVDAVIAFPKGLSVCADRVLNAELADAAVSVISRYDISFADLPHERPATKHLVAKHTPLRVICGTRHTFRSHPGLAREENKGTDIIIRGLAAYARLKRRPLEINLFEKGLDLEEAKGLCISEGLANCVIWRPQTTFGEFLSLHLDSDIAFDQVGSHWVGAGMYAMYMGLPVIANSRPEILQPWWGEDSPICQARSEEDILSWMLQLEDPAARRQIGERSRQFALRHFDCAVTASAIVEFLELTDSEERPDFYALKRLLESSHARIVRRETHEEAARTS